MKSVLVLLTDGVEEMECIAPVDLLRRAGASVTLAAVALQGQDMLAQGRNGIRLQADREFADVADDAFDLIVVPGGPGHVTLRQHAGVLDMIRAQAEAGRLLGAICAAPLVLHEAGVLANKAYTGHPTISAELPARQHTSAVIVDGAIITSQGAGTATRFGLALIAALFGEDKSEEIARDICYS